MSPRDASIDAPSWPSLLSLAGLFPITAPAPPPDADDGDKGRTWDAKFPGTRGESRREGGLPLEACKSGKLPGSLPCSPRFLRHVIRAAGIGVESGKQSHAETRKGKASPMSKTPFPRPAAGDERKRKEGTRVANKATSANIATCIRRDTAGGRQSRGDEGQVCWEKSLA